MTKRFKTLARTLLQLELYEILGIVATTVILLVFIGFAKRFDEVYGIRSFPWRILDDIVGVYQNHVPWIFTVGLTLLVCLRFLLSRLRFPLASLCSHLVRVMISFFLLMAMYKIIMFYIAVFNPINRDGTQQAIERSLFSGKLLSVWLEPLIHRPLTDLLSGAYVSWFILIYATVLVMVTHSRRAVADYVFTAIFTFYIGYFMYLLVPVMGPIFTVNYAVPVGGIDPLFSSGQALVSRDCFPSLHTGLTVVMMVQIWRYRRKWAWFYIPVGALIVCATIYLRFHYALDDIAGASLAIATTQIAPFMLRRWESWRAAINGVVVRTLSGSKSSSTFPELKDYVG